MILNYRIEEEDLSLALDEIGKFEEKMEMFIEKYPLYSYTFSIDRDPTINPKWIIDLKIEKHEFNSNRT